MARVRRRLRDGYGTELIDGLFSVDNAIAVGLTAPITRRVRPTSQGVFECPDEEVTEAPARPRFTLHLPYLRWAIL